MHLPNLPKPLTSPPLTTILTVRMSRLPPRSIRTEGGILDNGGNRERVERNWGWMTMTQRKKGWYGSGWEGWSIEFFLYGHVGSRVALWLIFGRHWVEMVGILRWIWFGPAEHHESLWQPCACVRMLMWVC